MRGPAAQAFLILTLSRQPSYSGVEITGTLPPQAARSADAQFWVQFEVAVPRGYNVEVITEAGDITTADIGGTASLHTQGGNIKTGRIGTTGVRDASRGDSVAKLETEAGTSRCRRLLQVTSRPSRAAGTSMWQHCRRRRAAHWRRAYPRRTNWRRSELDTVGGNITVAHAGSFVSVRTGGGQIDFGEVRGSYVHRLAVAGFA